MKRFLRKLFPLLLILAFIALGYHYRDVIIKPYNAAKGTYYIYKGDQAYSADNMSKTIEYYQKGLELYPKHYEAWFNLGNIYTVHEDYYSALDAYEQAIKANPKFVLARMNMGIVYSEDLGLFDEAIRSIKCRSEIFKMVCGRMKNDEKFVLISTFLENEFGTVWTSYLETLEKTGEHMAKRAAELQTILEKQGVIPSGESVST